jgi:hypothetical protein
VSKFATIEEYVDAQSGTMAEVARALAARIDATKQLGSRAVWYGHPVWSVGPAPADGPVAYIKAYSKHVTLGFWSADRIDDPAGVLKIGGSNMGSIKVSTVTEARALPIDAWVAQAKSAVAAGIGS